MVKIVVLRCPCPRACASSTAVWSNTVNTFLSHFPLNYLSSTNSHNNKRQGCYISLNSLMTDVLKFEYVKPQNFKHGTIVDQVSKLGQS